MDNAKAELVKSWLTKAQHDLGSAQLLANNVNPFFDTAIYHCQQIAEKALKAFLVYHDVEFEKSITFPCSLIFVFPSSLLSKIFMRPPLF